MNPLHVTIGNNLKVSIGEEEGIVSTEKGRYIFSRIDDFELVATGIVMTFPGIAVREGNIIFRIIEDWMKADDEE